MNEGLTSHGVGTVTEVHSGELAGCCTVIWDSDQCHTRPLHSHMGNLHACHVGLNEEYDLVLAEVEVCSNFEVVEHDVVEQGTVRPHFEVLRNCDQPANGASTDLPLDGHGSSPKEEEDN
mmetsp:Transcript_29116/g.59644  ORF Transcript_29116/g.59644 Transcript_29116/m.59644 type:complete len:120 (+) Transcript_29116:349-708(+)